MEKIKKIGNAVKRLLSREGRSNTAQSYSVNLIMTDEISTSRQLDYLEPEELSRLKNNNKKNAHRIFEQTKADKHNCNMLDNYIDKVVAYSADNLSKQHIEHLSVIDDIEQAQKSRIAAYQKRIEKNNEEIGYLKERFPGEFETANTSYEEKKRKKQQPLYKNKKCLGIVVAISSLLDYTTISTTVEAMLTQNAFLSVLLSGGIAILNNIIAAIGGEYARKKDARNKPLVLGVLAGIFVILFVVLFGLRWTTMNMLYTDTSQLFATEQVGSNDITMDKVFMTLLLSLEPALTGAMAFVLAFIGNTDEENEKEFAKERYAQLVEENDNLEVRIRELADVIERQSNRKEEDMVYELIMDNLNHLKDMLKEEARQELAKLIASAEGNGLILQGEEAVIFQ